MPHPLGSRLDRLARGRPLAALVVLVLAFNLGVFPWATGHIVGEAGVLPLDVRPHYTPAEAYAALEAFGASGRHAYAVVELTADAVYPPAYTLLLALVLTRLLGGAHRRAARRAALLPAAVLVADYAENAAIVAMLARFPERSSALASFAGACTSAKWALLAATLAVALVAAARRRWRPTGAAAGR